jgi:hypothetical protein
MHKMAAQLQLDPEFIYCLMATPQWDLQEEGLLPAAFQALSKTRQTLKVNLYAHCPEPEAESESKPLPPPTLKARNPEPKTLQAHCPEPEPEPDPGVSSPFPTPFSLASAQPKDHRDTSAKLARN